jgi:hypothetical protein
MPSLKYSVSGSALRWTSGRTAIDGAGDPASRDRPRPESDATDVSGFQALQPARLVTQDRRQRVDLRFPREGALPREHLR